MAIYYLVSTNREYVNATCDHQSGKIIEKRIRSKSDQGFFFNRAKEVIDENLRFKILN